MERGETQCEWPRCRRECDFTYAGHPLCDEHYDQETAVLHARFPEAAGSKCICPTCRPKEA